MTLTASVYIRADSRIKKSFDENFSKYKEQAIEWVEKARAIFTEIDTELGLIKKLRESLESDKKNLITDGNNDNTTKSET